MTHLIGCLSKQQYTTLASPDLPDPEKKGTVHWISAFNITYLISRIKFFVFNFKFPTNRYLAGEYGKHDFTSINTQEKYEDAEAVLKIFRRCTALNENGSDQKKSLDQIATVLADVKTKLLPPSTPQPIASLTNPDPNSKKTESAPPLSAIPQTPSIASGPGGLPPTAPPNPLSGPGAPPPHPAQSIPFSGAPAAPPPPGSSAAPPPPGFGPPPPGTPKAPGIGLPVAQQVKPLKGEPKEPVYVKKPTKEDLEKAGISQVEQEIKQIEKFIKEQEAFLKGIETDIANIPELEKQVKEQENLKKTLESDLKDYERLKALFSISKSKIEHEYKDSNRCHSLVFLTDDEFSKQSETDKKNYGKMQKSQILSGINAKIDVTKNDIKGAEERIDKDLKQIQSINATKYGDSLENIQKSLHKRRLTLRQWTDAKLYREKFKRGELQNNEPTPISKPKIGISSVPTAASLNTPKDRVDNPLLDGWKEMASNPSTKKLCEEAGDMETFLKGLIAGLPTD